MEKQFNSSKNKKLKYLIIILIIAFIWGLVNLGFFIKSTGLVVQSPENPQSNSTNSTNNNSAPPQNSTTPNNSPANNDTDTENSTPRNMTFNIGTGTVIGGRN